MSTMKNIKIALGIVTALGLYGCGAPSDDPKGLDRSYAKEYGFLNTRKNSPAFTKSDTINDILPDTIMNLQGRIVKVQPSAIYYGRSYNGEDHTPIHSFEYVFMNDKDGKIHLLIYPYSKGIMEGQTEINYRPLKHGKIDSELLIQTFVTRVGHSNHVPIEAEGIIIGEIADTTTTSLGRDPQYKINVIKGITYISDTNSIYK